MSHRSVLFKPLLMAALLLGSAGALAQSLPVSVNTSGNTATASIGNPVNPLAELTLTFDDASNLGPASLGISAQLVDISDPSLLSRLPDLQLTRPDSALPFQGAITLGNCPFHNRPPTAACASGGPGVSSCTRMRSPIRSEATIAC